MDLVSFRNHGIMLLVVAATATVMSAPACGADAAGEGDAGEGDDDGGDGLPGGSVKELCKTYEEAVCDYLSDCFGLDEDDCLADVADTCDEATDADADDVDSCVEKLDAIECGEPAPRVCAEAVTFPEEGSGGGGGGGVGGDDGGGGAPDVAAGAGGGGGDGDGDCGDPGELCSTNEDCCAGICFADDQVCAAPCNTGDDCASGCCVDIDGDSAACAPIEYCQ